MRLIAMLFLAASMIAFVAMAGSASCENGANQPTCEPVSPKVEEAGPPVMKVAPKAESLYFEGRKVLESKNYPKAAELLENVVALDPESPGPRLALARAYNGLQSYDRAKEQLREYVRLAPPGPEVDEVKRLLGELEDSDR